MANIVVGISGASGTILGYRAVEVLSGLGHTVHLVLSRGAQFTAKLEMGENSSIDQFFSSLPREQRDRILTYRNSDFSARIASGSCPTDAMLLIPCSMATLAAIAVGLSDNLIRRAADVSLKERRKLVIVPRETPLSEVHLENMLKITRMGGVIVPPVPGWYTGPQTLRDVEDFIVGRALDAMGIDASLYPRWGGSLEEALLP